MELLNPNAVAPPAVTIESHRPNGGANGLKIRALFGRAIRQWYFFLIFPILTTGLAYLYLRYEVPEYEVKGTILIKEGPEDQVLAQAAGGVGIPILAEDKTNLTNQIEILSSFSLLSAVVDSLNLDVEYIAEGRVKNTVLYNITDRPFLVEQYDTQKGSLFGEELQVTLTGEDSFQLNYGEDQVIQGSFGQRINLPMSSLVIVKNPRLLEPRNDATIIIHNPVSLTRSYGNRLQISTLRNSELLEIALTDEVVDRAIDFINGIIAEYSRLTILEKNEVATRTTEFVNDRLNYLSDELTEVELAAEDYILQNDIVGGTERELEEAFLKLRENELQMIEFAVTLDALDRLNRMVQVEIGDSLSYLPYDVSLESLNVSPLIDQYNALLKERERLLTSAREGNPVLLPVEQQIREIKQVIGRALREVRNDIELRTKAIQDDTDETYLNIRQIPGKQRGLLAIERQQNIREQLYLFLLQQREETALSSAAAISNVRIFEAPMRRGSTSPGEVPVYAIALLLGVLLPVGIVTVQEILNDTITGPEQIKALTGAPFLGSIAYEKQEDKIVVTKSSRSPIAEMFRMLRTNLQFMGAEMRQQTLLVTSSMGGEGKTFVCMNLGMSLAIAGKKVIMLGLDLRKPKLGLYLVGDNRYQNEGITNYLTGNLELEEIIRTSTIQPNLHYITSGVIPPNPAELLMLPTMDKLLKELKSRYDYLVIDMPPVGLVTDAVLLGDKVDAAIYVVRFAETKQAQLEIVNELYTSKKLPNLSVVLNGVKSGRGYGYGYGYRYGYGYGVYQ